MNLTDILERNTRIYPYKVALRMRMGYRTVCLTYKQVYDLSVKIGCFLEKQNIKPGDKVLLLVPNSPYWVCVFWGTLLRGAVLVPLNIQSTPDLIKKIAVQTQAKLIFRFINFRQKLPANLKVYDIELVPELVTDLDCSNFQKTKTNDGDLVQIMYTSGTTGEPKGVMHTNKNLISNVEALSRIISISSRDKFLSILPLSHVFEQVAGFLTPFRNGAEIIYTHSPLAIRDLMKEYEVTHMAAVPEFLRIVMSKIESAAAEKGKQRLFSGLLKLSSNIGIKSIQRLLFNSVLKQFGGKLHTVASGGAPLDPELERKWDALGITLLQGYGLTETSPVISTNSYKDHRFSSVGKVLLGVQVKIAVDREILVKGPNVFSGYFQNQEKTREVFTPQGWFKTGDIGKLDKDGFLFLRGRKKYMILGPGGQNVYPEDIEFELNKNPGVKDSCVVGLEKPGGQVETHAVLLLSAEVPPLQAGGEAEKIVAEANRHLTSYQQIIGFSIWSQEDLPRSATRKVKKEEVLKYLKAKPEQRPKLQEAKSELEKILAEITGTDPVLIKKDTKIVPELNLDSLLRIELVARIEEKFVVQIEETKITSTTTVAELQDLVKNARVPPQKIHFKTWPLSFGARLLRRLVASFILPLLWGRYLALKVEGQGYLHELPSPVLFMPNHLSYLDSLVVAMALPSRFRHDLSYAAAQDVVYGKYKSWARVLELFFNCFPFPRQEQENIKLGLEYLGKMLDHGYSVVIYPEGRQSLTGKLLPLKRGAGLVAVEMGCPVVPVKITGTNLVQPPNKIFPRRRGEVVVKFGKPIKFSKHDSYIVATERIQRALQN